MIFYEHAGEATHKRNWMGLQGASGKAQCGVADSDMRLLFVLSDEPLVQSTWYHITCVFAGAGIDSLVPEQDEMLYIFVDGGLEGSATVPQWGSGALGDITPDGTAPLETGPPLEEEPLCPPRGEDPLGELGPFPCSRT